MDNKPQLSRRLAPNQIVIYKGMKRYLYQLLYSRLLCYWSFNPQIVLSINFTAVFENDQYPCPKGSNELFVLELTYIISLLTSGLTQRVQILFSVCRS